VTGPPAVKSLKLTSPPPIVAVVDEKEAYLSACDGAAPKSPKSTPPAESEGALVAGVVKSPKSLLVAEEAPLAGAGAVDCENSAYL
jgi:hypothetical protein